MATRLCGKSSFQCTDNITFINSLHFAKAVVCIIHVMHNKELRTMTVRNDSKQDVGMGFLIYCWAGLEMR